MPPEQPAKRACAESLSGDRLSSLPDGLLHAVLSFLPAPQAVRTSALSRRWRHLWRTAPSVSIDMREFGIEPGSAGSGLNQKWRKFADFTTSLLLFRSGTVSLDKFRLYATRHCLRYVDRLVRRGIMYCPQVLEVLVSGSRGGAFLFPHLGASSCRLKRLHLNGVCLDSHFAEQIQSRCPVLEELELRSCSHRFQQITSRTLKRLIIDTLGNETGAPFVITAPYLVYLQMSVSYGGYSNGISRSLLVDLCNVPNLELGGFQTKLTSKPPDPTATAASKTLTPPPNPAFVAMATCLAPTRLRLRCRGRELEVLPDPPMPKRACADSTPAIDRLSALPDGLLHAVLSFVPAPQVVRTSALSQRWRHLWCTAPCVSISACQ
ncbi:hypothetical protein BAE44_0017992 [Dichanthelium oligosanthes]|uniref:F-box domain-containing protein n=1 Tax=Dichanthelium oligosanthes TaxID=888268 RepID=A0A1E5V792_9POAL|nr:hypothetical protein BAE44_0017992 [Dichanthelium oligosanthes]